MKKLFILLLALVMALSLTACGAEPAEEADDDDAAVMQGPPIYGEITAQDVLPGQTWEVSGGLMGEELWSDAMLSLALEAFGGSLRYIFDDAGHVMQYLGTGGETEGTYSDYDDEHFLLDFEGSQMLAAVADTDEGYKLLLSDLDFASTMILTPAN